MQQIIEVIAKKGDKIRNAFFGTECDARKWASEYSSLDWSVDLFHRDVDY